MKGTRDKEATDEWEICPERSVRLRNEAIIGADGKPEKERNMIQTHVKRKCSNKAAT